MHWEYLVVSEYPETSAHDLNDDLGRAGANGWELVSVVFNPMQDMVFYYFKRPAPPRDRRP